MACLINALRDEESQNRAGQAESSVRDLVRRMEKRSGTSKFRAALSLRESFGFPQEVSVAIRIR